MPHVDFITRVHQATQRDYLGRVNAHDKAHCAEVASRFDRDYWDGERCYGYGGYRYDGRWRPVAEAILKHYEPPAEPRILDVGCGKGFLLYEFTQAAPGAHVRGVDISTYAIDNSKPEIRERLQAGRADALPFGDREFDLAISINTLHNLPIDQLWRALQELERVAQHKHVTVESFRNEREKVNLLYWQLTCRSFYSVEEWEWLFEKAGYTGDYAFIFFE